jgi:hypothetical protein
VTAQAALAAAHLLATALMAGLVLFVAVVHYPLMARVGRAESAGYSKLHAERTTWIVAPLMLAELALAVAVAATATGSAALPAWVGLGLLGGCWTITFAVNVPQHARLARGFDGPTHAALVRWHWVRTLGWCARSVLAAWVVLGPPR